MRFLNRCSYYYSTSILENARCACSVGHGFYRNEMLGEAHMYSRSYAEQQSTKDTFMWCILSSVYTPNLMVEQSIYSQLANTSLVYHIAGYLAGKFGGLVVCLHKCWIKIHQYLQCRIGTQPTLTTRLCITTYSILFAYVLLFPNNCKVLITRTEK